MRVCTVPLELQGLAYAVSGEIADRFYGLSGGRGESEISVFIQEDQRSKLREILDENKFRLSSPGKESTAKLVTPETEEEATFHFVVKGDLGEWAIARRRRGDIEGYEFWAVPLEYIILRELESIRGLLPSEWVLFDT